MTMTSIGEVARYPDMPTFSGTLAAANFTWDTSTDSLSIIFRIPATGTIANIHYRVNSVSTPVMTHRIELRTVDATTGKPDGAGTLYGSSTSITVLAATYSANTNYTAAVNCTGATAGDLVALVFDLSAFTGGSFSQSQRIGGAPFADSQIYPYQMTNTAGSDVLGRLASNCFALEYGTDTYYPIEGIQTAIVSASVASTTVTNSGVTRRGNRLRSAVPRRACGIWIGGDLDGDCYLRLRLASDDSLLATATVDKDVRGTTGMGVYEFKFDAGATYNLVAGTDYYCLVEGNSGTATTISSISSIPENAMLDQLTGGKFTFGTSYNSGYTDVATQRYAIGIIYDGLDDGAGGGGGMLTHPGMNGRLV